MSLAGFLATVVRVLEASRVPYMLTGSLAAAFYIVGRATQDVDIVVDLRAQQVDGVIQRLTAEGFYVSLEAAREAFATGGQFNVIDAEQGWKADLIVRKRRPFSEREFERRQPAELLGVTVALATVEDLVIAKLEWARLGDSELQRRDVRALLQEHLDSLDRAYVERWIDALGLRAEWEEAIQQARG